MSDEKERLERKIARFVTIDELTVPFSLGVPDAIRTIIKAAGDDPEREGLKETPNRVARMSADLFWGYHWNEDKIESLFKTFKDGTCDEMVILRDVEFTSMCEHHILPFIGKAHIAYIPDGKIVGISKLARLLEVYSHRLQVQERLTTQITTAIDKYLQPRGSACVIEASHLCMMIRGVKKQQSTMITSSLTGCFREGLPRQEFLSLIRSGK